MTDLHIYDIPNGCENTAVLCAGTFAADYPERVGVRRGVAYRFGSQTFYAYRTKTGRIVVRGIS